MLKTLNSNSLLTINPFYQFQWEDAQQCYVLLYPEGMIKLNGSAGEILHLCDGIHTAHDIISDLEQKFSKDALKQDILSFLEDANDRGWIKEHHNK